MDEIGGVVLGPAKEGGFKTRSWGCPPERFAASPLQAMDYLVEDGCEAFSVDADLAVEETGLGVVLTGEGIRPFRTAWTFRGDATVAGDWVEGKALDPRATLFSVLSAFVELADPKVAVLMVMAEECAMDMARKAVTMLQREAERLRLIVNADVPDVANLLDGSPDRPAIRIYEGRALIDPTCGIRMADLLSDCTFHLTASRTGSQTALFSPLAPTISVALPGEGVHTARTRMSLTGIRRCVDLLCGIVTADMHQGDSTAQ
jgi:putative aminopeptidase FrvX